MSEIKLESTQISPVEYDIKAIVPQEEVAKRMEKSFAELAGQVDLKGFRKGKAPKKVVERMFKRRVLEEIEQQLVEEALQQTIPQLDLEPMNVQKLNPPQGYKGEGDMEFSFILETRPKVEDVDLEGISIEEEKVIVEDETIDQEVETLRKQYAVMEAVEDREIVEPSDWIVVDVEQQIGTEAPQKNEDVQLQLDNDRIFPELVTAIVGKKIGDEFDSETTYGDDMPNENLRGKVVRFKGTIKKIEKQVIPEIGDDFAKQTGLADDMNGLREEITKRLSKMNSDRIRRETTDKLWDAVVEKNEIALPPGLLKEQKEKIRESRLAELQRYGLDLKAMGIDGDDERSQEFEESLEKQAKNLLIAVFIQEKLSKDFEIEISDEDIETELNERAEQIGMPVSKLKARYGEGEGRENLRYEMRNNKLYDILHDKVEVTLVDPPKPEVPEMPEVSEEAEAEKAGEEKTEEKE